MVLGAPAADECYVTRASVPYRRTSIRELWPPSQGAFLWTAGFAASAGVLSLWFAQRDLETLRIGSLPVLLLLVPVLLVGMGFGLRGGLGAAVAVSAIVWLEPDRSTSLAAPLAMFFWAGLAAGLLAERNRQLVAGLSSALVSSRGLAASLGLVTESVADGLVTIDGTGTITTFNAAAELMFGYERSEIVGENVSVLMPEPDRNRHDGYIAAFVRTGEAKVLGKGGRDVTAVRKDGTVFPIALTMGESMQDGERIFVGAIRDVTERKSREKERWRHEQTLERQVSERTAALTARTRELERAQAETLRVLAAASEYRDDQTFHHAERVGDMAAQLARILGLSDDQQQLIRGAAPLHDLGKIGVSDRILLHPGQLTPTDRASMRKHTTIGHRIAGQSHSDVLQAAAEIALTHHEWWDGTGYPQRLRGNEIPVSGRIVALADVYDALTHHRPYRRAWTRERAIAEIEQLSGSQFAPDVVAAFIELQAASNDAAGVDQAA